MTQQHVPNTPRTHDADGRRVDEPVQCAGCLQSWPCEVERLRRRFERFTGEDADDARDLIRGEGS